MATVAGIHFGCNSRIVLASFVMAVLVDAGFGPNSSNDN